MKKIIALIAVAAMAVGALAGCAGNNSQPAGGESQGAAEAGQTYKVGVCQLVQHPALDAATQGFMDAISAQLGDAVTFDVQNASGDSATCSTIANGFVADGVDLILANATPALQAAVAATQNIPILGTSVTDFATALDMDAATWTGATGINVSGTSDLAPLEEQAAMIKELCPDAQNVGIIYCSAEANSKYQATVITAVLEAMGLTVKEYTAADTSQIATVVEAAASESDVIYVPTDNTMASATETVYNIVEPAGIPVIAGEEGICKGCGVATLSISYYDLGYQAGLMALDILVNGADVSTMDVKFATDLTKQYMADRCAALGITVPADYVAIEVAE